MVIHGGMIELDVRRWCERKKIAFVPVVIEFWKERAAIREYLGNMPRLEAEQLAAERDVPEQFDPEWTF
jgi:hypothetical protein